MKSRNQKAVTLKARFMGPTWGPSGADRTQVSPMLAQELCYLGMLPVVSLMASLVTTSRMQQCFNVPIDSYHEFLLLFYCCVLLEIKLTTTIHTVIALTNFLFECVNIILKQLTFQITGNCAVSSNTCLGQQQQQRKHPSSTSYPFLRGIHQWLVDSPHKGPVMWKTLPSHDIIITECQHS